MTNMPSLVDKCRPAPGVGDHDIVYVTSSASVRRSKPVQHKIYLWNKADLDTMKGECCSITTKFLKDFTTSSTVEEIWSAIKTSILELQEKHVLSKMSSRRFSQPWVNRNVKRRSTFHPRCRQDDSRSHGSIVMLRGLPGVRSLSIPR